MVKKRGLASYLLFSVVTLGIYGLWRLHVLARDVNIMCAGDGQKTRGLLGMFFFSFITFGIYVWVWWYSVANRLHNNARRYNLAFSEGGGTFLLWTFLGSFIIIGPFMALYIVFKNTNALANEYNKTQGVVPPYGLSV